MNLVSTFWHLQLIDQEIDDKTKRAHQVDLALSSDPALTATRTLAQAEQNKLAKLRATLHNRELEAKSMDDKIKEVNQRLYSGAVTNPKELDGYAKDLEMHKRNRSALDDKLLELMEAIDAAQKLTDEKSIALKHVESKRAGDLGHLSGERAALAARLSELAANREQTRTAIGADDLRTYDRLHQTKAGRAVVQLKRDACGACGMSVPTGLISHVRTGDEIVFCPSCGRILVA